MKDAQIAIISPAADYHAAAVAWGLKKLSLQATVISSAELMTRNLSVKIGSDGAPVFHMREGDLTYDIPSLTGFWFRRTAYTPTISSLMHPADIKVAENDWEAHYRSLMFMISSSGHYCLNPPLSKYFENMKPYQLQLAKSVGLKIPLTYIGNDFLQMREVFSKHEKVAFKTLTSNSWEPNYQQGQPSKAAFTQLLDKNSALWEQFHFCPAIVQEYVEKAYEVRITVIGTDLIAVGINSQAYDFAKIDWREKRIYKHKEAFFYIQDIPIIVRDGLMKYCAAMGLDYCAFDFVVTPENEWVFLEGNNSGQFLWCEAMVPETILLEKFCKYLAFKSGHIPTSATFTIADFDQDPAGAEALSRLKAALRSLDSSDANHNR